MSKTTYANERFNITRVVSASSLSLKIYLANYYPLALEKAKNLVKKESNLVDICSNEEVEDISDIKNDAPAVANLSDTQLLDKGFKFSDKIGKLTYKISSIPRLNTDMKILNPYYDDYKYLRKAYFGGRVEVFQTYGEDLYFYDVNSLFPFAMKNLMPVVIYLNLRTLT